MKIKTKLEEDYELNNVGTRFLYNFIYICRLIIASHLRNVYTLERLVDNNSNQIIYVNEYLFAHIDGEQTWVLFS